MVGPSEQMHTILAGHFLAQSLHAIAVLGVADLIDKGLVTIEQLVAAVRKSRS
jgi:hypothetical protein